MPDIQLWLRPWAGVGVEGRDYRLLRAGMPAIPQGLAEPIGLCTAAPGGPLIDGRPGGGKETHRLADGRRVYTYAASSVGYVDRWLLVLVGVAVAVGCLATALLVINNLRDIPSDTISGKRTLAVKIGDKRTRILYGVLMVLPFVIVPVVCGLGGRPLGAMALFAIVFVNPPLLKVIQGAQGRDLIPVLNETGRVQLIFGALLSIGLYLSA